MASDAAIQTAHNFNRQFNPSENSGEAGGLGFVDIMRGVERGGMVKSLEAAQEANVQSVADFSGDNPTMRKHGFSEASAESNSAGTTEAIIFAATRDLNTPKDTIKTNADSESFETVMAAASNGRGLAGDISLPPEQQAEAA